MASKKPPVLWQGHPVEDEEHHRNLDLKAAVLQFHHGLDRLTAEKQVKHDDRVERHQKAAAHHIDGMRAANAVGNHEDAEQHHAMYSLHLRALGLNPSEAVPSEVERWRGDKDKKHAYTFRGHPDDQFLVQYVEGGPTIQPELQKSEDPPFPRTDEEHQANMRRLVDGLHRAGTPKMGDAAKKRLYGYLSQMGISSKCADEMVASTPRTNAPPLRVIRGGSVPTAPKYGHLRVVKAEEWPSILSVWGALAKADGPSQAQGRVKQFDVKKTWMRNKATPEEQAHDYSAWLTPEQHQNGYRMFVLSHGAGNPVRVHLLHHQRKVGSAHGNVDQGDLEVENYVVQGQHYNRGLEASMLNAMLGHAKSKMGVNYLSHAPFTPEASAFIEAMAKPYGFELGEPEDIVEGEVPVDQPPGRAVSGGIKMRSQTKRPPRSYQPHVAQWWRTSAEESD